MTPAALRLWTVYRSPRDFPGRCVAREWTITAGRFESGPVVVVEDTIEGCRFALDRYLRTTLGIRLSFLYRLDRNPGDAPQIVESYV